MERQRPTDRTFTPGQIVRIRTYEAIGRSLAADLAVATELREELSGLLHSDPQGRERIYEGTLRHYFHGSGRDFCEVVQSPFVRAFEGTPMCTDKEAEFLRSLRNLATSTSIPQDLAADFQEWLERRLPVLAKGLQSCVLDTGVIPPLTPEEISRRSSELTKRRWEKPGAYAEFQRLGTQAAAENAGPRVFTDEVREQMQRWFDKGHDYETVAELLRGLGIETNTTVVKSTVRHYPDLHYTPAERARQQLLGFQEAVRAIFEATGSTLKTADILEKLGHTRTKTNYYLRRQGSRNKVYWNEKVKIEGNARRLDELVVEFASGGYRTVKEEYNALVIYLRQNGIDLKFSLNSYEGARSRILRQRTNSS